ncbi:MAG: RNA-binding cell elongation regulator Jag/EloR [Pseudomonadota bacterium]
MSYVEFTGKTVRDAIQKACEEFNVEEPLLEINVIEESTRGFLGIVGQKDARIRARKRDILKEVLAVRRPAPPLPEEVHVEIAEAPLEPDVEPAAEDEPDAPFQTDEQDEPEPSVAASPAFMENAKAVLEGILNRMMVEAEVRTQIVNGAVFLDIKGDGSGLLIGKKGQTLDALQFIVSKIVNKAGSGEAKVEVVVDSENYRLRKRENLREMAFKMSMKAKKTLKPVSFNPMPPSERRLVHLVLAQDKDVYTKSYGEGPMRRIIVYPRRGMVSKRRGR